MQIHIGHLYPHTMSTYGDLGNVICMRQRAQWRGIDVVVHELEAGTPIPERIDFYFFGGGQDRAQASIGEDLVTHRAERLRADIESGIPLLAICGGYQLLGTAYLPFDAEPIKGLGIFPVETHASNDRMIGNLVIEANSDLGLEECSTIVGFENHSGKTRITATQKAKPLGKVRSGFGNNGDDKTEGCAVENAIGCYLHGSVLPKNPHLADWLLLRACQRYEPDFVLPKLDDGLEWQTHDSLVSRFGAV